MMTKNRRLVVALILGLALLALIIVALPTSAAPSKARSSSPDQIFTPCGSDFPLDVIPSFPTQTDMIIATYSAEWSHIPTPQHQSHQIMGNVIRLDAIYYAPEVFFPVMSGWGGQVDVGILPTGTYTAQVYLTTVTPANVVLPSEFCGSRSFRVVDELHEAYLPSVAK